jgi:RNA polymerase sigma-70 factor, ECF subfamily
LKLFGRGAAKIAPEDKSDEELMADVACGRRASFDVLCRRHLQRSLRLAYRVQSNRHDAEEIVQDVFLQVWERADSWRADGARFSTWLYRIVVNRAIDYRRKRTFAPLDEAGECESPLPGAEQTVEERQLSAHVDAVIAGLPERQRIALGLCYYEEMTCAEAAMVMEVSVSAMESLLVRARKTARAKLREVAGLGSEGET